MDNAENGYVQMSWAPAPLDRNCWKVLKYLRRHYGWAEKRNLDLKFDERYQQTIDYLIKTKYLERITTKTGEGPQAIIVGRILTIQESPRLGLQGFEGTFTRLTPMANKVIEEKPLKIFDHWLTKAIAVWGAITGTIAILLDILSYFQCNG